MFQKMSDAVSQRIFAKENHLFQTVFFNAANETFGVRVQVWGSRWQFHRFDTDILEHRQELLGVQRIAIVNQITFAFKEAVYVIGDIARDLSHPQSIRLTRDSADLYSSRR